MATDDGDDGLLERIDWLRSYWKDSASREWHVAADKLEAKARIASRSTSHREIPLGLDDLEREADILQDWAAWEFRNPVCV